MKYALLFIVLLVAGCASTPPRGSVVGGECKLFHTPTYAVKGKTEYDQEYVDDVTEALVRGCKQPRPKARPASLDAPKAAIPVAAPPKKKHWWQKK